MPDNEFLIKCMNKVVSRIDKNFIEDAISRHATPTLSLMGIEPDLREYKQLFLFLQVRLQVIFAELKQLSERRRFIQAHKIYGIILESINGAHNALDNATYEEQADFPLKLYFQEPDDFDLNNIENVKMECQAIALWFSAMFELSNEIEKNGGQKFFNKNAPNDDAKILVDAGHELASFVLSNNLQKKAS